MKKRNRRTLKKRIRMFMRLSFLITSIVFSSIILGMALISAPRFSFVTADYISTSIAKNMSTKAFLQEFELKSLKDFNESSNNYNQFKKSIDISTGLNVDEYLSAYKIVTEEKISEARVFITIDINNKKVYSNYPKDYNTNEDYNKNDLIRILTSRSSHVIEEDGKKIGYVTAEVNPKFVMLLLMLIALVILFAFLVSLIIYSILSMLSVIPIINPILKLEDKITAIADENYEIINDAQIILKKPLREVESIANAANRIMQKMKGYNSRLQEQKQVLENQNYELESQNIELIESRKRIEEAREKLLQKEISVRNLLNHAGQGFLSLGRDLLVDKEYSQECINIFNKKIGMSYFPELIFPTDADQRKFLESVLKKIFDEENQGKVQIYISLLPEEIKINGRHLRIDYKHIGDIDNDNDDDLMVILTDITDKRYLENKIEQERNTLKMVVKVVANFADFIECQSDYYNFCGSRIKEIFEISKTIDQALYSIFREIHNFKGNFAQFYMINIVKYLHEIESSISDIKKDCCGISIDEFKLFIDETKLELLLDEDLKILKEVLGEEFFKRENSIIIERQKLFEIQKKMIEVLSPSEYKKLMPEFRKLVHKPFTELIAKYSDYLNKTSLNLNKSINPLIIEGGDFPVDHKDYSGLIKSFIHVFRNIVDHAIESPEERLSKGKNESGNVSCKIEEFNNMISIAISDDGKGIDTDLIKSKILEKNLCKVENISSLTEQEVLSYIFMDGFTTKETATELSGRGVGLAAVKNEVDKLNGSINVKTKKGFGTTIEFMIPYQSQIDNLCVRIQEILDPLSSKTKDFIVNHIKDSVLDYTKSRIERNNRLDLLKYTVFVNVKGLIEGKVILSIDENLSKAITRSFVFDEIVEGDEGDFIEDVLSECSNIILGNSLKELSELEDLINMDVPITICTDGGSLSYPESRIWTRRLKFNRGEVRLSFASLDQCIKDE